MLEVLNETRETKNIAEVFDVDRVSATMDFPDQSWRSRRAIDCHLHYADFMIMTFVSFLDVCFNCGRRKIG